jgi:hypothetical protein
MMRYVQHLMEGRKLKLSLDMPLLPTSPSSRRRYWVEWHHRRKVAYVMARRICRARDEGTSRWNQDADTNRFNGAQNTKDAAPQQVPPFTPTAKRHRVFSQCSGDA